MTHASEAGHWYGPGGTPVYMVERADRKGLRPTTLADARKLKLVPSVTGIIRMAAAPALETWKQKQVLLAALTLPRIDAENDEAFCARVMQDSKEQAIKAAERGTAIHAAIQGHYEGIAPDPAFWPYVKGAKEVVEKWATESWNAERSFSHPLGFGGKVDLSGKNAALDFKTKEFSPDDDLRTWDEHAMQLAAYREGLGIYQARCAIVYVSASHPGLSKLIEISEVDLQRGWEMFQALLAYWKEKNRYWC